jgi:predicted nuclease with TOPRIM domain
VSLAEARQRHASTADALSKVRAAEVAQRVELEKLRSETARLSSVRDDLAATVADLHSTIDRQAEEFDDVMAAKVNAEREQEETAAENDALRERNAAFAEDNAEAQTELARASERVASLQASVAKLAADRDRVTIEAGDAAARRDALEAEVAKLRSVFLWHTRHPTSGVGGSGAALVERATALERQLKLVTADRAKLQAAVAMATASASAADARLTELKVAYTVRLSLHTLMSARHC